MLRGQGLQAVPIHACWQCLPLAADCGLCRSIGIRSMLIGGDNPDWPANRGQEQKRPVRNWCCLGRRSCKALQCAYECVWLGHSAAECC